MPRISVPPEQDPLAYLWGQLAPDLTSAAAQMSDAIYHRSRLPLREFEAARVRIAHINDCNVCRRFRTARDMPGRPEAPDAVPEDLYEHVLDPSWDGYTARERLAIEFAERFALDHVAMDDEFWARLHAHFTTSSSISPSVWDGSSHPAGCSACSRWTTPARFRCRTCTPPSRPRSALELIPAPAGY